MLAPVVRDEQLSQGFGDPPLGRRQRLFGHGGRGCVLPTSASLSPLGTVVNTSRPTRHRSVLCAGALGGTGSRRLRRTGQPLKPPEQGEEILERAGRECGST